jgi:tetratricopeptide (TPR) repeat protein
MNRAAAAMARHAQVVAGNKPVSIAAPALLNQQDRLMLVALESDLYRLKEIQSHARRNEVKQAELLPRYREYLESLLRDNQPRTPAIIVRNLIWAIDTASTDADIAWALRLGMFAVARNLPTPDGFRRDIRNLFVGDISTFALKRADEQADFQAGFIRSLEMESAKWDLIDEVRGDLYKAAAQAYERLDDYSTALIFYQKADLMNSRTRVKRDITRITRILEKLEAANAPA